MSLSHIARQVTLDVLGGPPFAIGDVVMHPKGHQVRIVSGYYFDPQYGRLSNWWTWQPLDDAGKDTGQPESGYGWNTK